MARSSHNRNKCSQRSFSFLRASALLIALISSHTLQVVNSEAKEFDWSDLGVSLANPKTTYNGGSNNLRILVSPQRRMTKNYELDYSNNSQPTSAQGETSYILPTGSSSYVSSGHSAAYSALSASLASLKNRLNARGVSLNGQLSDQGNSHQSLYSGTSVGSYGSPISETQRSAPAQPTYLSMTNQQDQQSSSGYASSQNQNNDNKTIVLAIPAKINFLTDAQASNKQQQQQQQQQQPQAQQPQQVTVIQTTSADQQTRPEYSKNLALLSGHDGTSEHSVRDPNVEQEQQYVILNSASTPGSEHTQLMATSLGTSQPLGPIYTSGLYQQAPISMKYIPTYQGATIQSSGSVYDAQQVEHYAANTGLLQCLETCNSADPRWRKYTVSKYKSCCSRSSQYDPQFDQPSPEKLADSTRQAEDAYYNYIYRRTRARRSRRPQRERHSNRYSSRYSSSSSSAADQDGHSSEGSNVDSPNSPKYSLTRSHYYDSPYVKYYKIRQQAQDSIDSHEPTSYNNGRKYVNNKERSYRRGRSREFDSSETPLSHEVPQDDEEPQVVRGSSGYGSGDHSVEAGRYSSTMDDEEGRSMSYDDAPDPDVTKNGSAAEFSDYTDVEGPQEDGEAEQPVQKHNSSMKRRKNGRKGKGRKNGKETKNYGKSRTSRRSKINKQDSIQSNGTDFESTLVDDHYRTESTNSNEDDQRDVANNENGEMDKEAISLANKYKSSLNDSTVANLSKTTMHLKEILSLLEKKAMVKSNETSTSQPNVPTSTSTTAPPTTTNYYPSLFSSQFSNPSLVSALSSDYLTSELSLKSPYRDASSLSASLSLPSSYSSLASDQFSPLSSFNSNHYSIGPTKHLPIPIGPHPRKRRVPKNMRYNQLMMSKPYGMPSSSSLLNSMPGKSPFVTSGYYQSMQYPHWYPRSNPQSALTSYPFKNKNSYQTLSSKLAAAAAASGNLYSDDPRYQHTFSDPLSNVASSLRPSTTMRLRSKPFVFQPHVLPIYSRHSILTQPIDVKK